MVDEIIQKEDKTLSDQKITNMLIQKKYSNFQE